MQSLEQINLLVRNCTDCPISNGRTNSVPGEGNPQADVMFIGEGPGYYEDLHGRPFVGRASKLLDRLLASTTLLEKTCSSPTWSNAGFQVTVTPALLR